MDLFLIFKLSVYLLTAYVGVILGAAEWGWIPFVSIPMAIIAFWWCEVGARPSDTESKGLAERPSAVLGALSLLAAAFEFFGNNPEGKLLSGIHLVVYLTWIVLLQQKKNSRYWLLMVLGVLQVAVASVLTSGHWFGMSVVAYLVAATWTLSVFSLYRGALEFSVGDTIAMDARQIDSESSMLALKGKPSNADVTVAETKHTLASQSFNTLYHDDGSNWVSARFVLGVVLTSSLGLIVGVVFFVCVPRIWVGTTFGLNDNELPPTLRATITGLATEVRLGDMRKVLESNDPVLSLRIFDNQTNQPIAPETYAEWLGHPEPLFRGVILTEYSEGRWRPLRLATEQTVQLFPEPNDPRMVATTSQARLNTVRQEIRLEQNNHDILFCMGHPVAMRDPEGYRCGRRQLLNDIAVRRDWFKQLVGAVDYVAYSELPSNESRQSGGHNASVSAIRTYRYADYFNRCLAVPDEVERLRQLASDVVSREQRRVGRELSDLEKARAIESHLRDSQLYSYSLTPSASDPSVDPVEDFLFKHRTGHCQYFASALGLMLRSVGIPSRLVTGFKGGDLQSDGQLAVEKRFAHAWVEAWIEESKWITLDATPEAERTASVTEVGTNRNFWSTFSSQLSGAWENNILNFSLERQEDLIYGPGRELAMSTWSNIKNAVVSPRETLAALIEFLKEPRRWLSLQGLAMAAITLGLVWLARRYWLRWTWPQWFGGLHRKAAFRRVEFYERFAALMRSIGLERRPSQTQGEFVQSAAEIMSTRFQSAPMANALLPITQSFYRVRFGDEDLPVQEASEIDAILRELEHSVRGTKPQSTRSDQ